MVVIYGSCALKFCDDARTRFLTFETYSVLYYSMYTVQCTGHLTAESMQETTKVFEKLENLAFLKGIELPCPFELLSRLLAAKHQPSVQWVGIQLHSRICGLDE